MGNFRKQDKYNEQKVKQNNTKNRTWKGRNSEFQSIKQWVNSDNIHRRLPVKIHGIIKEGRERWIRSNIEQTDPAKQFLPDRHSVWQSISVHVQPVQHYKSIPDETALQTTERVQQPDRGGLSKNHQQVVDSSGGWGLLYQDIRHSHEQGYQNGQRQIEQWSDQTDSPVG